MFLHNYLYRIKCIIRDKETMFWTFLFPVLLATLFYLAFWNISNVENFSEIKLGIVNNTEYQQNTAFKTAISAVSTSNTNENNSTLFNITYTSKEKADNLLNNKEIEGYIFVDNDITLFVKDSGISQTIIKEFLDNFKQSSSTIKTILSSNPKVLQNGLLNNISIQNNYLKEVPISKSAPNNIVTCFYALIGMACLYGSFIGLKEITALQANQSPQGARVNIAPVHKLKFFTASILAAATIQIINIFVLLAYLAFILKVDFGNQLGYIALTCILGSITGVTFGTAISSLIKKGEGLKVGIMISSTMVMAFLSGMMYHGIKYIVNTHIPILAYLNPVNLITDNFYALYYYDTYTKFFTNITILSIYAVIFTTITYLVLRRQRYASL